MGSRRLKKTKKLIADKVYEFPNWQPFNLLNKFVRYFAEKGVRIGKVTRLDYECSQGKKYYIEHFQGNKRLPFQFDWVRDNEILGVYDFKTKKTYSRQDLQS